MLIAVGVLVLLPQVGSNEALCKADYETHVVTIGSDGSRTESRELFRLYQDARGRTRLEGSMLTGEGTTFRFAFLTDLRNRRGVVLDLATGKRLLQEAHRPPHGGLAGSVGQQAAAVETGGRPKARTDDRGGAQIEEDLGEAQIEGLAARGRRYTTASSVVEAWTALSIDQPSLLVRTKEPSREETKRLFNIRIGDPDPALFAPLDAP